MMSTKLCASDLVPASFIDERITRVGDETCVLPSRSSATAALSSVRTNVSNGPKSLLPPGRGPSPIRKARQAFRAHSEVRL